MKKKGHAIGREERHCIFILDKSGSMSSRWQKTIDGFNVYIEEQKKITDFKTLFSLVLFDSESKDWMYVKEKMADVKPLTRSTYQPGSATPLWDAIATAIKKHDDLKKVFCVILTDGYENDSREYKTKQVKDMIKDKTDNYGWGFLYLGAELPDFGDADKLGLPSMMRAQFDSTPREYSNTVNCFASYVSSAAVDSSLIKKGITKKKT